MKEDPNKNPVQDSGGFVDNSRSFSEDGVDLTLIRWMLSLTPEERLRTLQNNVLSLLKLRDGNSKT